MKGKCKMNNNIDHSSHVPLHIQVENYLREMIEEKEYKDGKMLPSEQEFSRMFGVSRNTFRAAMERLVRDELVVRKKGVGSFVNKERISTTLSKWESFSDEMNQKGIKFQLITKKITWEKVFGKLAEELSVADGTKVCKLERVTGIGGEPVVVSISYFHPRTGIKETEEFNGKLYEILEGTYSCVPQVSNEEISAIQCDKPLSVKLNYETSLPVLVRKRKVLGIGEKLLELNYAYYRADKFVYTIQIKKE